MSWTRAKKVITSNKLGTPNDREGRNGDIQVRQTNLGGKLYAKLGSKWRSMSLADDETLRLGVSMADHVFIDPSGFKVIKDSAEVANFAADTTITGGSITLRGTTGAVGDERLVLENNAISFYAGGNEIIDINGTNATLTIGRVDESQSNVYISSGELQIRNNTTAKITLDADGDITITGSVIMAGSVLADHNIGFGVNNYTTGDHINYPEGFKNVVIGWEAGKVMSGDISGDYSRFNVCVGTSAGTAITYGISNTCLGYSAGDTITTGDANICIGLASDGAAAVDHQIAIGNTAITTGEFAIALGDTISAATNTFVFGKNSNDAISSTFTSSGGCTFTFGSDERRKTNIKDSVIGLDFVNELKTRTFKWKSAEEFPEEWHAWNDLKDADGELTGEKEYHEIDTETTMHGFIAQEGKEVLDKYGVTNSINVWTEDENGMQRFNESKLIIPLIKAVQELSSKLDTMQTEINNLT